MWVLYLIKLRCAKLLHVFRFNISILRNIWQDNCNEKSTKQWRLSAVLYEFDCSLYYLWRYIYGEPDFADAIIFNEKPRISPGKHVVGNCKRLHCQTCRLERIILYINNAKISIDMAHLTFSHHALYHAVVAAKSRGVMIRIVTDPQMMYVRGSVILRLSGMGVPVHTAPSRLMMHHKFCIVDGDDRVKELDKEMNAKVSRLWIRKGLVFTGSLNWTKQGICNNYENMIVTSNYQVVQKYQAVFNELLEKLNPLSVL